MAVQQQSVRLTQNVHGRRASGASLSIDPLASAQAVVAFVVLYSLVAA
jgi:hypothetical protein